GIRREPKWPGLLQRRKIERGRTMRRGNSKTKKKKISTGAKGVSADSDHVSSPVPLRTVAPANHVIPIYSGNDGEPNILNDGNRSASHSPRGSVSESVHHFVYIEEKRDQESPPHVKPFINLSGQPIHPTKEPVFLYETNADRLSHPLNNLSTSDPTFQPREIIIG
ncbi:hypothetical protein Tco_0329527, partial [Tanacetum coccineum]